MIYVVGSLNMDLTAVVSRMPKAGETLAADSFLFSAGGKGANQAAAAQKLGGGVAMIGKVGNDAFGAELKENLSKYGVRTDCVKTADCPTGLAMITVCRGNNRILLYGGANQTLTNADIDEGLRDAKAGDVLMAQLEVPLSVTEYALKVASRKGMITILNPAPAVPLAPSLVELCELIIPNETETEILTGVMPDCEVNVALAVQKLQSMGARNVIITLGSKGSAVAVGKEITLIPAKKVRVVDTTAAGDTFVGAVAVRLTMGDDIVSAAQFATCASAVKITRRGATSAIPSISEVEDAIKKGLL